ncbi:hypothetical protein [Paenibacillus oleatilyticus]|uniref:hypothetical protein n=1 Tax=Paenibacillus oleatilyticus TaxID=2594886 RepID=UPI001C1FA5FF|nr:hypothetical protein [Paenibacillus oleatilyticus]MBU7318111.1 hypothetical protein [Paenibacillus oleatilyticus]
MEFAISIALSTLETVAIFVLIFVLFRYRESYHLWAVAGLGIGLAAWSLLTRKVLLLATVDVLFQLIAMYIFLKFVYRIRWFYASIMLFFAYGLYLLLQGLLAIVITYGFGYVMNDYSDMTTIQTFMLQLVTFLTALGIARMVKKKNWGFTFISYHKLREEQWTEVNRSILGSLIGIGVLLPSGVLTAVYGYSNVYSLIMFCIFFFWVYLLLLFFQKDYSE